MGIIRKTKAIEIILELFDQDRRAISVIDMVEQLKGKMNKTTVYRALDRMEQDGIVHSIISKEGLKWYVRCQSCTVECHSYNHAHFQCSECGKMFCLPINIEIPSIQNYEIESSEILLFGRCAECRS